MIYNIRCFVIFLVFFFILTMQGPLISNAAENLSVAIVPFTMQGMSNKEDYQKIINDSIIFNLEGDISIVPEKKINKAIESLKLTELTQDGIYLLGRELNPDYVIYGTVSQTGDSLSLFAEFINIKKRKSRHAMQVTCHSMDEVSLKVVDFTQKINEIIVESK